MRNSQLKFINLVFLLSALALGVISILSYVRVNEQAKASNIVSNTQLLKYKLNDALSHMMKAESAQRGYILTKDSSFMSEYLFARQQVPKLALEIQPLITNNEEQNASLKRAVYLFKSRLQYLQTTLEFSGKMAGTNLSNLLVKGKHITDELTIVIDRMIDKEDQLLAERTASKEKQERHTALFILMFSAISIAILTYSYFRLKQETITNSVLERKILERTKEISTANEVLSKQNLELKRKNEELSSFSFIANHDLKEPLRKIKLFTTKLMASNEHLSSESKMLTQKIIGCVERMGSLLEDIFVYTMTDETHEFELIDLNKAVSGAIHNLQEEIDEKQAIIQFDSLPSIKAVPHQMEQLFTNLISNSLKYSKKDERPAIKLQAVKENCMDKNVYWKITVADNGIGFNEAYREKIFEMFKRLHLKHEYPGTGMGLTICKKIVENHGGAITASSKNGDGAFFTIRLPEAKEN
ncbi:MAG TPA: ATP-binding protein [Flavisolibacter sp.]|jgi:signal transduction histidine kinase|nr:ATP-binding protein [Flavisolibacter sp.]